PHTIDRSERHRSKPSRSEEKNSDPPNQAQTWSSCRELIAASSAKATVITIANERSEPKAVSASRARLSCVEGCIMYCWAQLFEIVLTQELPSNALASHIHQTPPWCPKALIPHLVSAAGRARKLLPYV